MTHLRQDPRYAGSTGKQREKVWETYKALAEEERLIETRGELGVQGPTINLNTCTLDQLERIPKLNLPVRKAIILKRTTLPGQRFSSSDDLSRIPGVGVTILRMMKTFCLDPSTSTTEERRQPVLDTSGTTAAGPTPAPQPGGHAILMVESGEQAHYVPRLPPQLLTLWTQSKKASPGDMYQDSGCARSCAGPEVHQRMHSFLEPYGITPVQILKQEEFIFGNNQVEMSDCSFQYPVFFNGHLVGAIDIARLPVPCPALYSKRMMKQWKHVLDFDKQETRIGEFNLTYPFKDTVPILDIFQMPPQLALKDIPPCFRTDTTRNSVHLTTSGTDAPIADSHNEE